MATVFSFTGSDAIDGVSLDGSDSNQNITYMTRADFAGTFPKTNTPSRAMTDNVKALNLYTADMANGYINEADEAITTGAKNGLKIEDNGKTTELGYQLGADFNDPQWDALLDQLTVDEMENLFINAYAGLAELKSVGKVRSKDADGPAQIGGFTGMGAGTGFPSSSTLAQTWNADLALQEAAPSARRPCRTATPAGMPPPPTCTAAPSMAVTMSIIPRTACCPASSAATL